MTGARTFEERGADDRVHPGFDQAAGWRSFARALLNASSDAVMLIDLDGKVMAVNPAALRLLQWKNPGEVVGRSWDSLWDEKDRLLVRDGVEAGGATFEGTCVTAKGEARSLRVTVGPVHDESGRLRCLLACARDATDQRRRDAEARATQDEKLELFGRLVGNVVHDFNNVFAAVNSAARMLRRRVTDAPALEIVSHLDSAVQRGCALSTELLAFAPDEGAKAPCVVDSPTNTAPPTEEI